MDKGNKGGEVGGEVGEREEREDWDEVGEDDRRRLEAKNARGNKLSTSVVTAVSAGAAIENQLLDVDVRSFGFRLRLLDFMVIGVG